MKRKIAAVTSSRADYSHLYWPLRELASHPEVDLKIIALGSHLSPEFGCTASEIEKDGFPIEARIECLLSSDSDVGHGENDRCGNSRPGRLPGADAPRPV